MTPPEPDADAPLRPSSGDSQNTPDSHESRQHLAMSDTDPARAAVQDDSENTTSPDSPPLPADRQASRLKRPTHPGRPIHAPGASGLLEASEVPIPKPPSRPSSRPAQRPTSLLGSPPSSRPLPRPTDPLAPAAPPVPATPEPPPPEPPPPTGASAPEPTPPRTPASRPATLRPATPRRDTPTALSGPLSAPPGTSPLSPTRPDLDLESARPEATPPASSAGAPIALSPPGRLATVASRPTRTDPLPTLPNAHDFPLDLPLAPGRGATDSAAGPAPGIAPRAPGIAIALAFLAAILLPSAERPPWLLLDQPAGPTALALAGLLLLPGLTAGPPHLVRWALRLVVVVTLTALTALALTDGQAHPPWGDALDPLHGSLILLGLSLLLGAALAASTDRAPRIVAALGLLLLVAAAFIPVASGVPLLRLVATLTAPDTVGGTTAADTAAAIATLAFAALMLATAALRILRPRRRLALALAVWAAAIAPLMFHAALSTPPAAWMDAFVPLKASLAFAGALLSCATSITPALEPEPAPAGSDQAF